MKVIPRKAFSGKKPVSADEIARMADEGKDVSRYFTNKGHMVRRVNVDFTDVMLRELDEKVSEMNVSRQSAIKFMVRQWLDQHNGMANGMTAKVRSARG